MSTIIMESVVEDTERQSKIASLSKRLSELRSINDKTVADAAEIAGQLDRLGFDWNNSEFRGWPLLPYLRKAGDGRVIPNLITSVGANSGLLAAASKLPISDQKKIAANEMIDVVEGAGESRKIAPMAMGAETRRIVFAPTHIRSVEEQRGVIRERQAIAEIPDPLDIREDKRRGGFIIEGKFIARSEFAAKLERFGFREI